MMMHIITLVSWLSERTDNEPIGQLFMQLSWFATAGATMEPTHSAFCAAKFLPTART